MLNQAPLIRAETLSTSDAGIRRVLRGVRGPAPAAVGPLEGRVDAMPAPTVRRARLFSRVFAPIPFARASSPADRKASFSCRCSTIARALGSPIPFISQARVVASTELMLIKALVE